MSMTVVVTVDVDARFRGFLASCMLEVSPGVYTAPRMSPAVRSRVWNVLADWFEELGGGSVLMTWRDGTLPGGQGLSFLGTPPRDLHNLHGIYLARRDLSPAGVEALSESV